MPPMMVLYIDAYALVLMKGDQEFEGYTCIRDRGDIQVLVPVKDTRRHYSIKEVFVVSKPSTW